MNKLWVKCALIRAMKTVAQTAVAMIGTQQIGILGADWKTILSVSAMAGILSILTSVAGLPEVEAPNSIQTTFNADAFEMLNEVENYEDIEETTEE